jgi:hypothetical protein
MGIVSPPPKPSVPEEKLTRYLRELPDFVVLRNEEDVVGNIQRGGDLDLVVADLELAERTLIRDFGVPVRILRSSYVRGYSYDWGHVDLVPTIEWRGACYLRTEAVLENRRLSTRGRPVPRLAHEALVAWLTNVLFGGFFKARYAPEIQKAVQTDGDAFRRTLIEVAGRRWGSRLWRAAAAGHPEVSAEWTRPLRVAVWWRACFRSPVRTIQRYFAYVIAELRLRFAPPVPWIAILGFDAPRKSALVTEIVQRFAECPYGKVEAFPWPPSGAHQGPIALAAGWLLDYWTRFVHLRGKGFIVASDGMYIDLAVGPDRQRRGEPARLARALWWLLPKPDLVFVPDSSDLRGYAKQHVHVLNATLPPRILVDEVQRVIRTWMVNRSTTILEGAHARVSASGTDQG